MLIICTQIYLTSTKHKFLCQQLMLIEQRLTVLFLYVFVATKFFLMQIQIQRSKY